MVGQNNEIPFCQICLGRCLLGVTYYATYFMCGPCKYRWKLKNKGKKK